jgi:outer membrane biosynthesis protein TonB
LSQHPTKTIQEQPAWLLWILTLVVVPLNVMTVLAVNFVPTSNKNNSRTTCMVAVDFNLGGGTFKRHELNIRSLKAGELPPPTETALTVARVPPEQTTEAAASVAAPTPPTNPPAPPLPPALWCRYSCNQLRLWDEGIVVVIDGTFQIFDGCNLWPDWND